MGMQRSVANNDWKTSLIAAIFLCLSGCLAGCAGLGIARIAEPKTVANLAPDEAIVFGRTIFVGNRKNLSPYDEHQPYWLIFQQPEGGLAAPPQNFSPKHYYLAPKKDGEFYYVLPRGRYVLAQIRLDQYIRPPIWPNLEFVIPTGGLAYYLGELAIDLNMDIGTGLFATKRDTKITNLNSLEIVDRFEQDRETLVHQFQAIPQESVAPALLHQIPGHLPQLTEESGNDLLIFLLKMGNLPVPTGSIKFNK